VTPARNILQPAQPRPITHGRPGTYARGCRCTTEDNLFVAPQTTGCLEAWREYKRERKLRFGSKRVREGVNPGSRGGRNR
jgi:hypothetical protein